MHLTTTITFGHLVCGSGSAVPLSKSPSATMGVGAEAYGGSTVRKGHRGGRGHQARRDAIRSEAQSVGGGRPDSTDLRYAPAPRWTHERAAELRTRNTVDRNAAPSGVFPPPLHEPVTEAWRELAYQREAETVHLVDYTNAIAAANAAVDALRPTDAQGSWRPLPTGKRSEAAARRDAAYAAAAVESGAVLPLGHRSRVSLATLRDRGVFPSP